MRPTPLDEPEDAADLSALESSEFIELHGWASDNHTLTGAPPVVINPQADALSLLSWGLGQLQQCNALLDALGDGESGAAVFHFSLQAETALRAGVALLHAAECTRRRVGSHASGDTPSATRKRATML